MLVKVGIQGSGASPSRSCEHHDDSGLLVLGAASTSTSSSVVALRGLALPTCSSDGSGRHVNVRLEGGNGEHIVVLPVHYICCLSASPCPGETQRARV